MLLDLRPIARRTTPNGFTPCRRDPAQLIADLEDAQAAARMNDDDKLTFLRRRRSEHCRCEGTHFPRRLELCQ